MRDVSDREVILDELFARATEQTVEPYLKDRTDQYRGGVMDMEVISDELFCQTMTETVEPYLKERRTILYLEREPGKKIYCEFYDCGSDCPRGIILISHGFTDMADKFYEVAYQYLLSGYHVCIPEHCGHGRSYRLTDKDLSLVYVDSYLRYVRDLEFVAQAAKERWNAPLYLYAHSMGGGIGAYLAGDKPDLFAKVILSSPMIRPLTGNFPWRIARIITGMMCLFGQGEAYVPGQHPYQDDETFEESAYTSRARFDRIQEKKRSTPLFQLSGASYRWLREAGRLSQKLLHRVPKQITCPVLLLQAENDTYVSKDAQEKFMAALKKARPGDKTVQFVQLKNTKHELHNATADVLAGYWDTVLNFLAE